MDFARIFRYAFLHLCIIAITIWFYGYLFGISDYSFRNLDQIVIVLSTIPLSLPCYIYFALKCGKHPYLSSLMVFLSVLLVLQLIYTALYGKFFVATVTLIPGILQITLIVGATYLARKQGFIKYGL